MEENDTKNLEADDTPDNIETIETIKNLMEEIKDENNSIKNEIQNLKQQEVKIKHLYAFMYVILTLLIISIICFQWEQINITKQQTKLMQEAIVQKEGSILTETIDTVYSAYRGDFSKVVRGTVPLFDRLKAYFGF